MSIKARIQIKETREISVADLQPLYEENHWTAISKPQELLQGLINSHSLISAWDQDLLVGLGNTISDGNLVVYYSHLLVLPNYQRRGIGRLIMNQLLQKYEGYHQQVLLADQNALNFYASLGFKSAGNTQALWIYQGSDH